MRPSRVTDVPEWQEDGAVGLVVLRAHRGNLGGIIYPRPMGYYPAQPARSKAAIVQRYRGDVESEAAELSSTAEDPRTPQESGF